MADALSETGQRIKRLEDEVAAMQDARAADGERAKEAQAAVAAAFTAAAERIELITRKINQGIGSGGVAPG